MSEKFLQDYQKFPYANLSQNVKEQGGVDQFITNVYTSGYDTGVTDGYRSGQIDTVVKTGIVTAIIFLGYKGVKCVKNKIKERKTIKALSKM